MFSFDRAARTPCIDASPSALLLRLLNTTEEPDARCQHSAEFARSSMERFSQARQQQVNVAMEFTPLPSSWRRRSPLPTTTSVKPLGCSVLLKSPPIS